MDDLLSKEQLVELISQQTGASKLDLTTKTRDELARMHRIYQEASRKLDVQVKKPGVNANEEDFTIDALKKAIDDFNNIRPSEPVYIHPESYKKLQDQYEGMKPGFQGGFFNGVRVNSSPHVPPDKVFVIGDNEPGIGGVGLPAPNIAKDLADKFSKSLGKKLEQDVYDAVTSVDGYTNAKPSLSNMMRGYTSEQIIKALLHKQGRFVKDNEIKSVIDYLHRKSHSLYAEKAVEETQTPASLDRMIEKLNGLPGVKANVMYEEYPETATIILKVNTTVLDDEELETISDRINETITSHKPSGLGELEVIYHHKEVY